MLHVAASLTAAQRANGDCGSQPSLPAAGDRLQPCRLGRRRVRRVRSAPTATCAAAAWSSATTRGWSAAWPTRCPACGPRPVATVAQAARATLTLGANLLVVEMPGRTFFEVRQMLRTAAAATGRPVRHGVGRALCRSWTAMRIAEVIGTVTLSRGPSEPGRRPLDHRRAVQPQGAAARRGAGRRGPGDLRRPGRRARAAGSASARAARRRRRFTPRRSRWMRTVRVSSINCNLRVTP